MTEPWQSIEQIVEQPGVTRDSICRWIDAKELPANEIACIWKSKTSEVDAWVPRGGCDDGARKHDGK